jgi:predicted phage tail component-like protein
MSLLNKRSVFYNSYDLENISGFTITEINSYSAPSRDLKINALASADGVVVSGDNYNQKRIIIKGVITLTTRELMEQSIEEIKGRLNYREAILKLNQSSTTREYTATYETLEISDVAGGFCNVVINFVCSDPLGYSPNRTTLLTALNLTTTNQSYVVTPTGYYHQLPYITVDVNTVTGGTGDMTLSNLTTGQTITINNVWANGDILIIDAETGDVTINGTASDFTGAIPILEARANTIVYTDNFTTRQVDIIISYRKRAI